MGGEHAYEGRLGKNWSRGESRHSIARLEIGLTALVERDIPDCNRLPTLLQSEHVNGEFRIVTLLLIFMSAQWTA